jgi:peptide/nickel transport system substrate-binding protein
MIKKTIWMLVSLLMVMSLVMASCGPAEEEEAEVEVGEEEVEVGEGEVEVGEEEMVEEEGLLSPETPKYGGYVTTGGSDPIGFDPAYYLNFMLVPNFIMTESLLLGDWAKGPAGTGETDWTQGLTGRTDLMTGQLAESYEMPDNETIIFHIRKGVHWWNKAPVNGREFTAEDAAWSINREWNGNSWLKFGNPPEDHIISATALDKYTLEVKVPPHAQGMQVFVTGESARILPPELGDDMVTWETIVGTGPYMITDYVIGSSLSYEKNPNYWGHDPIHPENQLPYLDGLRTPIIPDASTLQAGFRTGKIDMLGEVSYEDWQRFMQQVPDLQYMEIYASLPTFPCGRTDKPELPFKDVRVRQAMNMAVDQRTILEDYYEGHGALLCYPFLPTTAFQNQYVPLEEMPEVVQELFDYNPTKAKQLLTEAGYPDGFKTSIICTTMEVDLLSIIREYLLDVNIDMELQPGEGGMVTAMVKGRQVEEMCMAMTYPFAVWKMLNLRAESSSNPSYFETPQTKETYNTVLATIGKDTDAMLQALKDTAPHVLEYSWGIWLPAPSRYNVWQAWIQNYHGETNIAQSSIAGYQRVYIWLDQDLKKSMGY